LLPHALRTFAQHRPVPRFFVLLSTVIAAVAVLASPASAQPAPTYRSLTARASYASLTTARARAQILHEATSHLGARYRRGATGPSAFDCSGFVRYVYGQFGVALPHHAAEQARVVRIIPTAAKRPGDLVFFRTSSGHIDHVGIYAGGNYVYAASRGAGRVKKQEIYTSRITVGRIG
jgi:cell wall-associated NlpC family hydrolase